MIYYSFDIFTDDLDTLLDEIQVIPIENDSDGDDIEVVLECKKYSTSTKKPCQDEHKIKVLKLINTFLRLPPTQVVDDDSLLTGSSLLNWLKDWFPEMEPEFLQGISESQAVRNCQASLSDLYDSIAFGLLKDNSISIVSSSDLNSLMTGSGISSHFPYIRCRLTPDSLVTEQQKQNTYETANLSDMLLDNLYRYAENFYLKRCHADGSFGPSSNCSRARLSDTHVIERIDFIAHPKLFSDYEEEKEKYKSHNKPINEKLLFHGTHPTSLNKILDDNFKLTADPVNRQKQNIYGKGIYFSEFPAKSLQYGEALLLCKVILGKEEVVEMGYQPPIGDEYFRKNFDSRKVIYKERGSNGRNDGLADIYMVPNPRQILPCYVIYLKKKEIRQNQELSQTNANLSKGKSFELHPKSFATKIGEFYLPLTTYVFPMDPYLQEIKDMVDYVSNHGVKFTNEEKQKLRWREKLFSLVVQVC